MGETSFKSNWKRMRFCDIADNVIERVIPQPTDSSTYIGLEHLDSNSSSVDRWGTSVNLIGQKLRMKKGDILFARRNAYLRRVSIAPFDGVFSAHGMVLRAKPGVCLQNYLLFFMQSDIFMDRAIQISVGSLSPTINWTSLAEEEFFIPPPEEQRTITNLLMAASDVVQGYKLLVNKLDRLILSFRDSYFSNSQDWKKEKLVELFEIKLGKMLSPKSRQGISPRKYLRNINVQWGRIDISDIKEMDFDEKEFEKYHLLDGDLLICEGGEVGRSAIWHEEVADCCYQNAIHRLRPLSDKLMPEVLMHYMFYAAQHGILARFTGQSTIAHLPAERLGLIEVFVPPIKNQIEFLNGYDKFQNILTKAEQHFNKAQNISRTIISNFLQDG